MRFSLQRYPSNEHPAPILIPRKEKTWEATAIFNPGVIFDNGIFRMLYRTYSAETKEGAPHHHRPGNMLSAQRSYLGYAESTDGIHFERRDEPCLVPSEEYDSYSCEDPRITKIGDTFYITYTAIDGPLEDKSNMPNIRIALASTKDFVSFKKHGIIGPPTSSKAGALFQVGNRIGFVMTIGADSQVSHVAIRYYDSIEEIFTQSDQAWKKFLKHSQEQAALKTQWWLYRGPELGAPPIETERGWLFLYSGEASGHIWTISAALTDRDHPEKLIARAPGFVLEPITEYERNGLVPNVTFPSGAVVVDDMLYVYYGCADTVIGLATCKLNELLNYLEQFKGKE